MYMNFKNSLYSKRITFRVEIRHFGTVKKKRVHRINREEIDFL